MKNFNEFFQRLLESEVGLTHVYNNMLQNLRGGYRFDQCVIAYPTINGEPTPGERSVLFHKEWFSSKKKNHQGLKIDFAIQTEITGEQKISVSGVVFCHTAESCERLKIPF